MDNILHPAGDVWTATAQWRTSECPIRDGRPFVLFCLLNVALSMSQLLNRTSRLPLIILHPETCQTAGRWPDTWHVTRGGRTGTSGQPPRSPVWSIISSALPLLSILLTRLASFLPYG